jgi:hypothetical protein
MSLRIQPNPAVMRVMKKYTRVERADKDYCVILKVDHQSFTVACCRSRDNANWFRWQLAIALTRLIESERKKP